MGGDDSQKLLPWRGILLLSRAQTSGSNYEINNVAETAVEISRRHSWPTWHGLRLPPAWVIFGKHTRVSSDARRRNGRFPRITTTRLSVLPVAGRPQRPQ